MIQSWSSSRQPDPRQEPAPKRPGAGASKTGPPFGVMFARVLPFLLYREVWALEASCSMAEC